MAISESLKKLIESNAIGFATVDKKGKPHAIAVAYVKVVDDKVVISNAHIKRSIWNIEQNENVALVVWNKEWETACIGYELIGKAKNHTSGKWFDLVRQMPDNEGYTINSAIVIKITKIKPLIS